MKYKTIGLIDLTTTDSLFKLKKWDIDKDNAYSLYNRFLYLLDRLDNKEKEVVYELIHKMKIIHVEDYKTYLFNALEKLIEDRFRSINGSIYVMPVLDGAENMDDKILREMIKSGSFLAYLFRNIELQYNVKLAKFKIEIIGSINAITEKRVKQINNSILILSDDFIGSGEQVLSMISKLEQIGINRKNIAVLGLFILKEGKLKLKGNKVSSYEYQVIEKALGDNQEDERKREIIESISLKCGIDKEYLGYNNSEALIVLNRTPNNTYTFFHSKGKGENKNNFPLFPRF